MSDELSVTKWDILAKEAYQAYGSVTDFKNYQGLPMPSYEELPPTIRSAWKAVAEHLSTPEQPELDAREKSQIAHAHNYADYFASAGVPGHGQFMLISKLARKLGL